MPIVRKVSPAQAAAWVPPPPERQPRDDRYTWVGKPAMLFITEFTRSLREPPKIGDVVRLRAVERVVGVVLDVRVRKDGHWTHVELAYDGKLQWVSKGAIAEHLGRTKGITRVDQPTKRINDRVHGGLHGWFVRVYEGKLPKYAKTFSDKSAGGRLAALRAAMAFHAAHVEIDPSEGIPFE